jgi:hypothetical protein
VNNRRVYPDISVGDMDACWKWSKVCDVGVTLSGLWTLAGSGETPKQVRKVTKGFMLVNSLLDFCKKRHELGLQETKEE